ncbi:hypothetical protein KP509_36G035500 [Ceratopteris richardii]|uniref:Hexosyltransferase n=1 Tax=Ceratopteris richardii TaxID=49495 RepID=A0A8T2QAT8_CERRI|nr:hypothetical protein KP509_36G035500 [Ceratopteris richardii]
MNVWEIEFRITVVHLIELLILLVRPGTANRYIIFDVESDLSEEASPSSPLALNANLPRFREAPAFRNGKECLPIAMDRSTEFCDSFSVHIAMTLDRTYIRGSTAAIFSVVKHAACPGNIVFHFLTIGPEQDLNDLLTFTFPYLRFKVYTFDEALVKDRISTSIREALEQPLNYARTYIADILPACVERVIYLDSDLVVVDDIVKLWTTRLGSHPLGAPIYCHVNFSQYFTETFWSDSSMSGVFKDRNPCYFNTGVMVMDLAMWRRRRFSRAIEQWMEVQRKRRIYDLGSLPPFLLVFAGDVKAIEPRWNQHGLGGDNFQGHCRRLHPGPVSLLHWSGKGKPWIRLDNHNPCPLDSLWAPYDLLLQ